MQTARAKHVSSLPTLILDGPNSIGPNIFAVVRVPLFTAAVLLMGLAILACNVMLLALSSGVSQTEKASNGPSALFVDAALIAGLLALWIARPLLDKDTLLIHAAVVAGIGGYFGFPLLLS